MPGHAINNLRDEAGYTAGFDYLRLLFASMVLVWHCLAITNPIPAGQANNEVANVAAWAKYRVPLDIMVPGFFVVSGFLVSASLTRNRISAFLALRLARVLPALWVSVTLCALIMGPITTTMALSQYFTSAHLWKFFLNGLGLLQTTLPGVFVSNPLRYTINGSLWTIYYELICYLALAWLALLGLHRRRRMFLAVAIAIYGIGLAADGQMLMAPHSGFSGTMVVACFFAGAALHLNREAVPSSPMLATAAASITVALLCSPHTDFFAVWPLAYCVTWLGQQRPRRLWPIRSGDYSYGLYLFSYPISQTLWWCGAGRTFQANLALSIPLAGVIAYLSWRLVERPALANKARFASWAASMADNLRTRCVRETAPQAAQP